MNLKTLEKLDLLFSDKRFLGITSSDSYPKVFQFHIDGTTFYTDDLEKGCDWALGILKLGGISLVKYRLYYFLDDGIPDNQDYSNLDTLFLDIKRRSYVGWINSHGPYMERELQPTRITQIFEVELFQETSPEVQNAINESRLEKEKELELKIENENQLKADRERKEYFRLKGIYGEVEKT